LLAEIIQASILQIRRAHQNAKFAAGLELQKKGLCKKRHIRWIFYVNNKDPPSLSVLLSEEGGLRFNCSEDLPNDFAHLSASDQRVERQWVRVEGLKPEDVVVLVAKRPKGLAYELLKQRAEAAGAEWAFEGHGIEKCVLEDTVARFKGLEAQAVVLWVGDEIIDGEFWETVYVGTTRAKSLLNVVGSAKVVRLLRAHPA
jgi:hypothetical protein